MIDSLNPLVIENLGNLDNKTWMIMGNITWKYP